MNEPSQEPRSELRFESPRRIGIVLAGMEKANRAALQFLVLQMNGRQTSFEYEFLPALDEQDPFLARLGAQSVLGKATVESEAGQFGERYPTVMQSEMAEYSAREPLPTYFLVISMARISEDYFTTRIRNVSVIALGNWETSMAPPSILEFVLTLIVRESIASISKKLRGSIHYGTKGCVCDFNVELDTVRMKVLNAFVCNYCRRALDDEGYNQVASDALTLLQRRWLGKSIDPESPASIAEKLGYALFTTKGLTPSLMERTMMVIHSEGLKLLLDFTFKLVFALMLLWFGLKMDGGTFSRSESPIPVPTAAGRAASP